MPDIKIVKTNDINKVPREANQLIFCRDTSFYFDYSDDLRLRNVGSGSTLNDFVPNQHYEKNDFILYEGKLWRFALPDGYPSEFRYCDWEYICTCGQDDYPIKAIEVTYDNSASSISATTVQQALDVVVQLINGFKDPSMYKLSIGTF